MSEYVVVFAWLSVFAAASASRLKRTPKGRTATATDNGSERGTVLRFPNRLSQEGRFASW